MIRRFATGLLDRQQGWADPFGAWTQRKVLLPAFARSRPLKDALNGRWLGHSLHAALTDVPVGAFTAALALDAAGTPSAASAATAVGVAGMLASALAGWADYADTDTRPQRGYATVHQLLMLAALSLYLASLSARTRARGRALPMALSLAGYTLVAVSAYVGGELVYGLGNMVDRHSFRAFADRWQPLDLAGVTENVPVKVRYGAQSLVVVRRGDAVYALHDVCAHAGCSLAEGTLVGDCIECGCHGSRYRLDDGRVVQGPATFDQPAYEVRPSAGGGFEARHLTSSRARGRRGSPGAPAPDRPHRVPSRS